MSGLRWVIGSSARPYLYAYAYADSRLVGWVSPDRRAFWHRAIELAEGPAPAQFPTLDAAKEYIENRHILWVASGELFD